MKFMLLCYDDEGAWARAGQPAMDQAIKEAIGLAHDMASKGQYLMAAPLQPADTAKNVRVRDGKQVVVDGPFTETHEVLGGFYLIDVSSREEAIEIASRHPGARLGTVEIRPIQEVTIR